MPCDTLYRRELERIKEEEAREAKRKELEAAREAALRKIEEALAAGTAALVEHPDGTVTLVGAALPQGMHDSCVLASLQARNSMEFQQALANAGLLNKDFVGIHNKSHGW